MVVLAIIGTLLPMAHRSSQHSLHVHQLALHSQAIARLLEDSRNYALMHNTTVTVYGEKEPHEGWGQHIIVNETNKNMILRIYKNPENIITAYHGFPQSKKIIFLSDGTAGSNGHFKFTLGQEIPTCIFISTGGTIRQEAQCN